MAIFYQDTAGLKEIGKYVADFIPEDKEEILRRAETACRHRFILLGQKEYQLKKKIDWNRDPATGKKWFLFRGRPFLFSWGSRADIKFVWELNRQQGLFYLGQAFILTKDKKYAEEITAQIVSWIDNNKNKNSVNWLSALELSLRVISWLWALNLTDWLNTLEKEIISRVEQSIYEQTRHIERKLQKREICNNHLIGEICALVIVGIIFPQFKDSERWLKKGLGVLTEQFGKQVYEDGVDKEQAWDYHRFVLDFYTLVVILCQKNNIPAPADIVSGLEKMYEALLYSGRPDGTGVMAGDDDNGRAMKLGLEPGLNFLPALSTGAVLFNRGDMKFAAGKFYPESLWLLGIRGLKAFEEIKEYRPVHLSKGLKDSGTYSMRSAWTRDALYLSFDCGPQGLGRAGHGHADSLSFEMCAFGKPLVIDSGTFTYNGPKEWRNFFRGTGAHNTVVVDQSDQAVHLDPYEQFGWSQKADGRISDWYSSERFDFARGSHNGYQRLADPVTHQRSIFFVKPEYWIITDFLSGEDTHKLELLYHFPPGEVKLEDGTLTCRTSNEHDANILIVPICGRKLQARVIEGSVRPIQGWVSFGYGDKLTAPVLEYSLTTKFPICIHSILFPFKNDTLPSISLRGQGSGCNALGQNNPDALGGAGYVEMDINDSQDFLAIAFKDNSAKTFGSYQTNAEMLFIRKERGRDKYKNIVLTNGSYVIREGQALFKSERRLAHLEIAIENDEAVVRMSENMNIEIPFCKIRTQ